MSNGNLSDQLNQGDIRQILDLLHPDYQPKEKRILIPKKQIVEKIKFGKGLQNAIKVQFVECEFYEQVIFDNNDTYLDDLSFDRCKFNKAVILRKGEYKNEISFNAATFNDSLSISGGIFTNLYISIKEAIEVGISGGSFEQLHLSHFMEEKNIRDLNLSLSNVKGLVKIQNIFIIKTVLSGIIKDLELIIENLECNYFVISDLENNGLFKIFGLFPPPKSIVKKLKIENVSRFVIDRSSLGKAYFNRVSFDKYDQVSIYDSYFMEIIILNSNWSEKSFSLFAQEEVGVISINDKNSKKINPSNQLQLKEVFRQLKFIYDKQGDTILSSFFYKLEMNRYDKTLKWRWFWHENFYQKSILYLSKQLTNYGKSFKRPLIGILISNLIILMLFIYFFNYKNLKFVNPSENDWQAVEYAIGEYFRLINPLRRLDVSLKGFEVVLDLLSRILSSYFIYGMIRSSRRFLK